MTTTSAYTSTATGGMEGVEWNNKTNLYADDSSVTDCGLSLPFADVSEALICTNFGFEIPDSHIIQGITVTWGGKTRTGGLARVYDSHCQLMLSGSPVGTDQPNSGEWGVDSSDTYGSSSDEWGLSLTPADVNDATFGVFLQCYGTHEEEFPAKTAELAIDYCQITIEHQFVDAVTNEKDNIFLCFRDVAIPNLSLIVSRILNEAK